MNDPHEGRSFYDRLAQTLQGEIESGKFPPGSRFPSEAELCERFAVSRITVRQALSELVRRGLILRMQGKGSFVRLQRVEKALIRFAGFAEEMKERGSEPQARVISLGLQVAGPDVGAALRILPETPTIRFERVRLADGIPLALKVSYLPHDIFHPLFGVQLSETPLYEAMATHCGQWPDRADETLEAAAASKNVANALDCAPGTPLVIITGVVYNRDNVAIEYVQSYYRGDAYRFAWQSSRR